VRRPKPLSVAARIGRDQEDGVHENSQLSAKPSPFAVGDIGWMNGNAREKAPIFDMNHLQRGNHPQDHTIVGSTEEFRSGEFRIEQVSLGGDFHCEGVKARFLSMFGMFSTTTPRNDASSAVGQWDLQDA
jgi:hypothetical protein